MGGVTGAEVFGTRIDVFDTRPGGRCRPATRRVGAPESPAKAIEEIGMVQVHTCVSVRCDQCGRALGSPGYEAHYPSESAALDAAVTEGWQVGPGGRFWCSTCGAVLTCEDEGHQFTEWHYPQADPKLIDGGEYRYCRRCCLHESRALVVTSTEMTGEMA
ncbi:MAG: hypothetical protein DLM60_21010 [Pseudonocardiales bacterium]|nr:MAG: hypothetical protein DLM60_21010 [Pseudonocardiales bacterium]